MFVAAAGFSKRSSSSNNSNNSYRNNRPNNRPNKRLVRKVERLKESDENMTDMSKLKELELYPYVNKIKYLEYYDRNKNPYNWYLFMLDRGHVGLDLKPEIIFQANYEQYGTFYNTFQIGVYDNNDKEYNYIKGVFPNLNDTAFYIICHRKNFIDMCEKTNLQPKNLLYRDKEFMFSVVTTKDFITGSTVEGPNDSIILNEKLKNKMHTQYYQRILQKDACVLEKKSQIKHEINKNKTNKTNASKKGVISRLSQTISSAFKTGDPLINLLKSLTKKEEISGQSESNYEEMINMFAWAHYQFVVNESSYDLYDYLYKVDNGVVSKVEFKFDNYGKATRLNQDDKKGITTEKGFEKSLEEFNHSSVQTPNSPTSTSIPETTQATNKSPNLQVNRQPNKNNTQNISQNISQNSTPRTGGRRTKRRKTLRKKRV